MTIQDQKMTVHDFFLHFIKICKFSSNFFGKIENVKRDRMSSKLNFVGFTHYSHIRNKYSLGTLLNIYTYLPQTLFPHS